jgi:hypothetical protein
MSFNPKYNWLRWMAVLPGAALAGCLAYLSVYHPQCFVFGETCLYSRYIVPCQASTALGIFFICCGTEISPCFKQYTCLVLVFLALLSAGIEMFIDMKEGDLLAFAKEAAAAVGVLIGYGISPFRER